MEDGKYFEGAAIVHIFQDGEHFPLFGSDCIHFVQEQEREIDGEDYEQDR